VATLRHSSYLIIRAKSARCVLGDGHNRKTSFLQNLSQRVRGIEHDMASSELSRLNMAQIRRFDIQPALSLQGLMNGG
jgi:hypothetical protein